MAAILEIRGVSCSLGGRPVLQDIHLDVAEGETVVLLGRSGSGKTTLLKAVNGLVAISAGEIRFEGKPLANWERIRVRRRMGYVIQEAGLFPHWTVERNVGLGPQLERWEEARIGQRVAALLDSVGLPAKEFGGRYPRELSGGQRQRVGIARALAADPPLLLLDEPFGALDPITRFELQRQFLELRTKWRKAALFVTHDVREALMMGTRIALLKEGRIDTLLPSGEFPRAGTSEAKAFLASLTENGRQNERPGR